MKQIYGIVALALALVTGTAIVPSMAAPPTVVPSPGYDARLQEQRAAAHAGEAPRVIFRPAPHRKSRPHR